MGDMSKKGLLNTRYFNFVDNTYDYWVAKESKNIDEAIIKDSLKTIPVFKESNISIYIHVPFCANKCLFCAFA